MNTIMPVVIVLALGGLAGLLARRFILNFVPAVLASAAAATILWVVGVYGLLLLTAPAEAAGPVHWGALFYVFLTSAVSASLVCLGRRPLRSS